MSICGEITVNTNVSSVSHKMSHASPASSFTSSRSPRAVERVRAGQAKPGV